MIRNDANTTPRQRFYYEGNTVQYHGSFDPTGQPAVDITAGTVAYIIAEEGGHGHAAHRLGIEQRVPAGALVRSVVSLARVPAPGRGFKSADDLRDLNLTGPCYEPAPGDMLVVMPHPAHPGTAQKAMQEALGVNPNTGLMVVPGTKPLPEITAGAHPGEQLAYSVLGAITLPDTRLLLWPQYTAAGTQRLVDESVAYAAGAENPLEVAVLRTALDGTSLLGALATNRTAATYLEHFDSVHGTNILPAEDPLARMQALVPLGDADLQRFQMVSNMMLRTPF